MLISLIVTVQSRWEQYCHVFNVHVHVNEQEQFNTVVPMGCNENHLYSTEVFLVAAANGMLSLITSLLTVFYLLP